MAKTKYSPEQLARLLMTNAVSDHNENEITKILLEKVRGDKKSEDNEDDKK